MSRWAKRAPKLRRVIASVRLPPSIQAELDAEARRTGRSLSSLMQTAWRIARARIREGAPT